MKLAVGQIWEEADARTTDRRQFVIVEIGGWMSAYIGCVRYYGLRGNGFALTPKTGRRPRRFYLVRNELKSRRFAFTGKMISMPEQVPDYPPTKSYGL